MELKKLQILGFTNSEIKVYLELLKHGKLKASEIVSNCGVASSKIYELLDSLEKKGVIQMIPEKVNQYVAKSFKYVDDLIQKQEKELKKLKTELKKYEELSKRRYDDKNILLVKGKKNFAKIIKENVDIKKTFGYGIKWQANIDNMNFQKAVNENIKKGIDVRVLYDYNTLDKNIKHWNKITPNYKFIESNGIALDITDNSVLISIIELDSTLFIKSKDFANVMKQLYEGYWKSKK